MTTDTETPWEDTTQTAQWDFTIPSPFSAGAIREELERIPREANLVGFAGDGNETTGTIRFVFEWSTAEGQTQPEVEA